jgi:conjugative relaxase-like TrwC/TraI family protein
MIHPRRLKGKPANIARYYTVGDYYSKGADEHSEWGGRIAAELGLEGKVDPVVFKDLLAGKVAGQQLGRHRGGGEIQHHPGWDFAVNAPKSVSIMALVADDKRIAEAHENAVTVALSYLEEHAATRLRVDKEVVEKTTGRLVFARFTEHASRELDPHLHTHVVVMNITDFRDGGKKASLETRALYAEQMAAGQVYRNELALTLRELGYEVDFDPRTGLFEMRGVPNGLVTSMSRRAEQIDDHARANGLEGQAARRKSFYETRGPKMKVSAEALHAQWQSRVGPHRNSIEKVRAEADKIGERSMDVDASVAARAMLFGLRQSEGKEAVNNLGQLLRIALASHVGEVRVGDIRPRAEEHEEQRKLLATRHQTGDDVHTRGRTTRRTARLELALSDHLALALNDAAPLASADDLRRVGAAHGLSQSQTMALLHLGSTSDRVVGVEGVAGSGKSTLVGALREAAGDKMVLIALAPTSSAAAELGGRAGIESRTVASLIASGGRRLDDRHVLVLDEAGQLGNRQAVRMLEISRITGARLLLLGDDHQTGAIEQGKPFWLMQRLGLSTASLTEAVRHQTRSMKAAVTQARLKNYAESLASLDAVTTGADNEKLAEYLVTDWMRLKPENRAKTNILVLENTTRLIVNSKVREALKTEGVVAAEEARLLVLAPSGMTDQEKQFARFYNRGQVLIFSRDNARLGIARDVDYKVTGIGRDARGRQIISLIDEQGRIIQWDPRLSRASQVNVFKEEERKLAEGDRIQWRLVNHALDVKNAERGTVERLDQGVATIRWDRGNRVQKVDLFTHRNWDHGYAETVYSAQSKTYDRVYIIAPVNSPLVTGKNFYTAITRARYGVRLWTQNHNELAKRLQERPGDKTSALEGLGRLHRDSVRLRQERHGDRWERLRAEQRDARQERKLRTAEREVGPPRGPLERFADRLAGNAQHLAEGFDRYLEQVFARGRDGSANHGTAPQSGTNQLGHPDQGNEHDR